LLKEAHAELSKSKGREPKKEEDDEPKQMSLF